MGDLGKLIVAKGFKNLPKVQNGHSDLKLPQTFSLPPPSQVVFFSLSFCLIVFVSHFRDSNQFFADNSLSWFLSFKRKLSQIVLDVHPPTKKAKMI